MTAFTFSAVAFGANGESHPRADMARGMDVLDAAALIAQEFPGGVPALAARMGVSPNTLQHKLNPNNTTHHLTLKEALALQQVSGMSYVLHAMASGLDHVALRSRPDPAEGDPLEAFMFLQREMGELTAAAADALRGGGAAVSPNQLRRIEYHANEAMAGISGLVGAVAARAPKRKEFK